MNSDMKSMQSRLDLPFSVPSLLSPSYHLNAANRKKLFAGIAGQIGSDGSLLLGTTESFTGVSYRFVRRSYHNAAFDQFLKARSVVLILGFFLLFSLLTFIPWCFAYNPNWIDPSWTTTYSRVVISKPKVMSRVTRVFPYYEHFNSYRASNGCSDGNYTRNMTYAGGKTTLWRAYGWNGTSCVQIKSTLCTYPTYSAYEDPLFQDLEAVAKNIAGSNPGFTIIEDFIPSADSFECLLPADLTMGENDNKWDCPNPQLVGNPVNILNGNKYEKVQDLTFPSSSQNDFSFSRYYNSRSEKSSILGYGWTHSYSVSLTTNVSINNKPHLHIIDPTGRGVYFAETTPGQWDGAFYEETYVTSDANGYTWHRLDGTKYHFNTQGQLDRIDDASNSSRLITYESGKIKTVTDGYSGRILTFNYVGNLLDHISGLVTPGVPDGIWARYGYDANNNLTSVTYADGSGFNYEYNDPNDVHNLTAKKDKQNHPISNWDYDLRDRVHHNFTRDGKVADISYVDMSTVEVTDAYGKISTYTLAYQNGIPKVESISDSGCTTCSGTARPIRYAYDDNYRVIKKEYANGRIDTFSNFDTNGNPQTVTENYGMANERIITYSYHPVTGSYLSKTELSLLGAGNKVTIRDYDNDGNTTPNENPTSLLSRLIERGFTKDSFGNVVPYEYMSTYEYNAKGQVVSVDGPLPGTQDLTAYSYDPITGDRLSITTAMGTTTFGNYDAAGNPGYETDPNGLTTTFTYDGKNRVVTSTTNGVTTSRSYNTAGDIATTTSGVGGVTSFVYDTTYGRLDKITDHFGNYLQYSYDPQGNRIRESIFDPANTQHYTQSYSFQGPDHPGKLWKVIYPDATETIYTYDDMGNISSMTDPLHRTTYYFYDAENRLVQTVQPGSATTAYGYDRQGNLISVTDATNKTTSYNYDDLGLKLSETSPDTGTTRYAYDAAGNLATKTDARGITVNYSYDALNRLVSAIYPDPADNITYTYDQGANSIGRLSSITDSSGSTSYEYDAHGRMIRQTHIISGKTYPVGYSYDNDNAITAITYPNGRTVTYNRDLAGRILSVQTTYNGNTKTLADNLFYKPFGPLTSLNLDNGLSMVDSHDLLYRFTQSQAGNIYNRSYGYNAAGYITAISDLIDPAASQTFVYDDLGRLTSAAGKYGSLGYTYDAVGNRLTKIANSSIDTYSYQPGTNRLESISGPISVSLSYDMNGNPLSQGENTYTYSRDNRLIAAVKNGTTLGHYTYNALGKRVTKTADGKTLTCIYDTSGNLIAEMKEAGEPLAEYAYVNGRLLAKFSYETPIDLFVHVGTDTGKALQNIKVYAFTEAGSYTGIYAVTDEQGNAEFNPADFTDGYYKFRADYLASQFWTQVVTLPGASKANVTINEEVAEISVTVAGMPTEGVKVYLFNETGSYLGICGYTDAYGKVYFDLPAGISYKFRADYLGNQYWSDVILIAADSTNAVQLDTGGGTLTLRIQKGANQPLPGLNTYLFNSDGSYLGMSATTDANGQVSYNISGGDYQIRGDYLGYHFWSELGTVSGNTTMYLTILHQDVRIDVIGDNNENLIPRAGVTVYLFTSAGAYLGQYQVTDTAGQVFFNLPDMEYKVRVDYLSGQYWSNPFIWTDQEVVIKEGDAMITVANMGLPLDNINTYVFNNSGSYLGINGVTDTNGNITYRLPAGDYNFRADYLGSQFWSDITTVIPHVTNPITISTGGGEVTLTLEKDANVPMAGVKSYLFNPAGSYLGSSEVTNDQGIVSFNLADGDYLFRIDYLANQFWTDVFSVPDTPDITFTIPHKDITVTVAGNNNGNIQPKGSVMTYLFTSAGSYLGQGRTTDSQGRAIFNLPELAFKIRADYLGAQYWADVSAWSDPTVSINEGIADVTVTQAGSPVGADVPVYLFDSLDSYLSVNGRTNTNGLVSFRLPQGTYKFRADYLGSQYWSTETVLAHQAKAVNLSTGGGSFTLMVDNGEGGPLVGFPVYLFNSAGSYLGQNGQLDEDGEVSFNLADGNYKFRLDYLGYQFWTGVNTVPATLTNLFSVPHQDATITVTASDGLTSTPLGGLNTYLFTKAGAYVGQSRVTDASGRIVYNIPDQDYKVRVDYLGSQYWSGILEPGGNDVTIDHGQVDLHVTLNGVEVDDAPVYLFKDTGAYLGRYERTDNAGDVSFILPGKAFKFRVDFGGVQYWSQVVNVMALETTRVDLALDQLALDLTNNPKLGRVDGTGPVYHPGQIKIASLDPLTGLMTPDATGAANAAPVVYYYITDHLGTPQVLTNETGAVVWQADYAPFGEVEVRVNTVGNNLRFPGQYYDEETGLHYNWHRYYDPRMGRYLTPDPIGLDGGINLFVYAGGNPVNKIDPTGLYCGPGPIGDWFFPDNFGAYDFTDACKNHDNCYGVCGKSKAACDGEFCDKVRKQCNGLTGLIKINCESMANSYCNAVKNLGGASYDNAQKDNCCRN